jgi:hypothetical protein
MEPLALDPAVATGLVLACEQGDVDAVRNYWQAHHIFYSAFVVLLVRCGLARSRTPKSDPDAVVGAGLGWNASSTDCSS